MAKVNRFSFDGNGTSEPEYCERKPSCRHRILITPERIGLKVQNVGRLLEVILAPQTSEFRKVFRHILLLYVVLAAQKRKNSVLTFDLLHSILAVSREDYTTGRGAHCIYSLRLTASKANKAFVLPWHPVGPLRFFLRGIRFLHRGF